MLTPTDPIADIERVAFVTQRFHELRGLITASFGGALIAAALMVDAAGVASSFGSSMQALIVANCVYVLALIALDRSYRQTYGDVVATPRQRSMSGLLHLVVMSGALCDMVLQPGSLQGPSIAAVSFASYTFWIALRDWRWRIHYLAAAAAGVTAAFVTAAVPGTVGRWGLMEDPARGEAHLLAYTLIALGMVAAGLFDHRLLAKSLGPSAPALTARPRPSSGVGPRFVAAAFVFGVAAAGFLYWAPIGLAMVLPLVMIVALIVTQVITTLADVLRACREWNRGDRVSLRSGDVLHVEADSLVVLFLLALAAAVEGILATRGLLALTLAVSLGWIAIRDWPHRKRYLVAAASAAAFALLTRNLDPARAFAMLVCVAGAAVMLERLFTYRTGTRNADTI